MANFVYTNALDLIAKGSIDFLNDDIRIALVDNTTTADTEEDVTLMNGFSTLGELSGTGYSRKVLASKAINKDEANDRSEMDCADVLWSSINAGTAAAAILYKHVSDDTDSIPIAFIDSNFPFVTNGGDFTLTINAEGLIQVKNSA